MTPVSAEVAGRTGLEIVDPSVVGLRAAHAAALGGERFDAPPRRGWAPSAHSSGRMFTDLRRRAWGREPSTTASRSAGVMRVE
jgi:hypothetical protein